MFINIYRGIILFGGIVAAPLTFAQQGPSNLNISGGLYQPNGTPITNSSVNFKLEVYDKTGTCLLYSENHYGQDLSNTKGGFALELGKGAGISNAIDSGNPTVMTSKVFENSGVVAGGWAGCPSGTTLSAGDNRLIRVQYDLGGGFVTMSPDVPIGSAAYSIVAETLQGKRPSDFIQVHDDVTNDLNQANVENIFSSTNYPKLTALLGGTSGDYIPSTPTAAVGFNNQRITNVATPTGANDATNKNYVDSNIGGKTADVTGVGPATGNGYTLIWDQATAKWTTGMPTATDNTKLPLAGGTMTGAIAMGGNNITNTGHITMAPQMVFNLGTFTTAQETTLVGTLTAGQKGATWYNSTTNEMKVWNGTAAITQAYLTAGKLDATWLPSSVVTSSTSAGGDLTGTYPNPTIANDKITSAKVDSAGIGINRLVISDQTTGANLKFATCGTNEVLRYEGVNGWICRDPSAIVTFPVSSVNGKTGVVVLNANDLGLGTAALENVGTAAGNVPQLDAGGKLPAGVIPTITLAGDVTGATGTTSVVKIQGRDVANTAPNANEVLMWNNTTSKWEPAAIPSAPVTTVAGRTGAVVLDWGDINNGAGKYMTYKPNNTACGTNELLKFDGTNWVCATFASYGAGDFMKNGSVAMTGALNMGSQNITAVGTNITASAGLTIEQAGSTAMVVGVASGASSLTLRSANGGSTLTSSRVGPGATTVSSTGGTTATTLITSTGTGADAVNITTAGANSGITLAPNGTGVVTSTRPVVVTPTVASPNTAGAIWFDSGSANAMKYYDGSAWVTLGSGTGDFLKNGSVAMTGNFNAGGNSVLGNTTASGNLTLDSTSNATKGYVNIQPSGGNVGIGTATPGSVLDIYGASALARLGGSGNITLRLASTNGSARNFDLYSDGNQAYLKNSSSNAGAFIVRNNSNTDIFRVDYAAPASSFFMDASGNVGLGTNSPARLLDVAGPIRIAPTALPSSPAAGDIALDSGASNGLKYHNGSSWVSVASAANSFVQNGNAFGAHAVLGTTDNYNLSFITNNTNRITLGNNGTIGLYGSPIINSGWTLISAPATGGANLTLTDTTSMAADVGGGISFTGNITTFPVAGATFAKIHAGKDNGTASDANGNLQFYTNAAGTVAERMRISPTGNVGIGTNNPGSMLHVNGPMRLTPAALPGTPAAGDLAFDSGASNALKFYDGSAWQTVGTGTGSGDFLRNGSLAMTGNFNAGGNSILGNTTASANLTLESTSNATKGYIILQPTGGNVGIGTTSPAARFHVENSTGVSAIFADRTASNWNELQVNSGTSDQTKAKIQANGGANTVNIGSRTASALNLVTSDSTRVTVDTSGNVGVGTTSPARLLHVNGPMRVTPAALPGTPAAGDLAFDSGASNALKFYDGSAWQTVGTGTGSGDFMKNGSVAMTGNFNAGGNSILGNTTASANLTLESTSNATKGYVNLQPNGGNVGIGTTTPLARLDVRGAGTTNTTYGMAVQDSAGTYNFLVRDDGAVGIGTTAPLARLHVSSGTTDVPAYFGNSNANGYGAVNFVNDLGHYGSIGVGGSTSGWPDVFVVGSYSNIPSLFLTNGTEKMRITESGSVGVGTNAPARILHVNGPMRVTPTALPGTPAAGDLAFDSGASNALKFYDGSAWQTVGTGTGSGDFLRNGSLAMTGNFNAGGNSILGNTTASANLTLESTSNATKGYVNLQPNGGNVGIGTSTPTETLELVSSSNSTNSGHMALRNTLGFNNSWGGLKTMNDDWDETWLGTTSTGFSTYTGYPAGAGMLRSYSRAGLAIGSGFAGAGSNLMFLTNGDAAANERMRITSTGNVGIGTTTPARVLHVNGPMRITPNALPGTPAAGDLAFDSGASNALKFYDGSAWQTVGTGTGSGDFLRNGSLAMTGAFNAGGNQILGNTTASANLDLESTSNATKGYILLQKNGGNVGIGTTAPSDLLHVRSSSSAGPTVSISTPGTTNGQQVMFNLVTKENGSATLGSLGTQGWQMWANGLATTSGGPEVMGISYFNGTIWKDAQRILPTAKATIFGYQAASAVSGDVDRALFGQNLFWDSEYGNFNTTSTSTGYSGIESVSGTMSFYTSNASTTNMSSIGNSLTPRMRIADTGNVGIGTNNPARLLHVNGPMRITPAALPSSPAAGELAFDSGASNALKFYNGSAWQTVGTGSGDFLRNGSLAMTGAFNAGGNQILGNTTASANLDLESTSNATKGYILLQKNGGNVGIGTTTANSALDVRGVSGDVTSLGIMRFNSNNGTNDVGIKMGAIAGAGSIGYSFIQSLHTGVGNDANLILNPAGSGNVGVGTTSPARLLHVNGPIRITPAALPSSPAAGELAFDSGASNALKYHNGTSWVSLTGGGSGDFMKDGSVAMTGNFNAGGNSILGNTTASANLTLESTSNATKGYVNIQPNGGNVGVGTTSPSYPLHVKATNMAFGAESTNSHGVYGQTSNASSYGVYGWNMTNGAGIYGGSNTGIGGKFASTSGYAIITTAGNVGLGTSTPARQLHVNGAMRIQPAALPGTPAAGDLAIDSGASNALKYHNGSAWVSLTGGGSGDFMKDGSVAMTGNFNAGGNSILGNTTASANLELESTSNATKGFVLLNKSGGNVGIGTATPSAKLDVNGNTNITGSLSAGYSNSSGIATSLTVANNAVAATGTGTSIELIPGGLSVGAQMLTAYETNNNDNAYLAFTTRASDVLTERLRVTSSGNVGIGTTTPGRLLHVNGPIRITPAALPSTPAAGELAFDSGASNALKYHNGSSWVTVGSGTGDFMKNGSVAMTGNFNVGGNTILGNTTASADLLFESTSNATKGAVKIQPNGGYVGIGTTSTPASALQIVDSGQPVLTVGPTTAASGNAIIDLVGKDSGTAKTASIWADWGGGFQFQPAANSQYNFRDNAGSSLMFIEESTGRVGIGTTSPPYTLTVHAATPRIDVRNTSDSNRGGYLRDTGSTFEIGTNSGIRPLAFAYDGTERMRIISNGNVGIGSTLPAYKLDVVGDIAASGCLRSSAGIASGTCVSDERLKTDIQPFDVGLDALMGIQPHFLKYNGLGGHPVSAKPELGVIAQEVERTAPELIAHQSVKLNPEDDQTTEIKQVNYTAFTYVLINAVKDLYHRWFDDSQAIHRELASKDQEIGKLKADAEKQKQELEDVKARLEKIERMLNAK